MFDMAVVHGGDEQLIVRSGYTVRMFGRDMSIISDFELSTPPGALSIAASEEFIYATINDGDYIACLTHDGTKVAKWEDPVKSIMNPVLAPGGLLFCLLYDDDDQEQDEIIALDAQTLQPCHRFGLSMLEGVSGLCVVGEELFVCDTGNDRLQVFSLAGEHRRSITGEWKQPQALCFVKDRLYLLEEQDYKKDEEGELITPLAGRRIFVLSLQGDTLQVYTHPDEGQRFDNTLCYFAGKLLAPVRRKILSGRTALRISSTVEMVALSGA